MQRTRGSLLLVAALLMGFSAVVNALIVVPHLREDLAEIHVRATLLSAVSLALDFGIVAMFGFAVLVLAAGLRALRGFSTSRVQLAAIAAVYLGFGTFAFVRSGSAHTLGYAAAGLLIGVAAVLPDSARP